MSNFLVTNIRNIGTYSEEIIENSVFDLNFKYDNNGIFALTTRKLGFANENAYQEGNDFVLINGTLIYDGSSEKECLKKIFNDFSGDLNAIRNKCIGNYAVCIYKNGHITVFGESSACYDIYYYSCDGEWVVSSSISTLAKVLWNRLSINKLNVVESYARYAILNDETVFNEILRLSGWDFIRATTKSLEIMGCNADFQNSCNYQTTIDKIVEDLKSVAKSFYNNFGTPTISMTGGLDSRMTLASYLAVDVKPRIVYGLGDSSIAVSGHHDCNVDRMYSEAFGLDFEVFPWNETIPLDKYWMQFIKDYDEATIMYGGNKDTMDYFYDTKAKYCEYGFWGEFYRDAGWLLTEDDNDFVSIETFAEKWYLKSMEENIINLYPGLKKHIINKLYKVCNKRGMDPQSLSSTDLLHLALLYYQRAHGVILNLVNRHKYCHYIMSESCIVFNTNVSCKNRKKGKLILDILANLYPQILSIPIYSGWKYYKYNKQNKTLELDGHNLKGFILKLIPHNLFNKIYKLIRYRTMPKEFVLLINDPKYKSIVDEYLTEEVKQDLLANRRDNSPFVVRLLIQGLLFEHWGKCNTGRK